MTREEAKNLYSHFDKFNRDAIVDRIYDDIESRVCENCEYIEYGTFDDMIYCSIDCSSNKYRKEKSVTRDFGCNLFKRKLESK